MACFIMTINPSLSQTITNSMNSIIIIEHPRLLHITRINIHHLVNKSPLLSLLRIKTQHSQMLPKRGIPSILTHLGKWLKNYNNKSIIITHKGKIALPHSNFKITKSNFKKLKNNSKVLNMSKNKPKRPSTKLAPESATSAHLQLNKMTLVKKLPKRINSQTKINRSQ